MVAVVIGRLIAEIGKALSYQFEFKRFWVDSTVVIYWLKSTSKQYKPFVSSRIQEFQDTHINWEDEIRYVPSKDNPADCLTRPISCDELEAWHAGEGCKFFKLDETEWPENLGKEKIDIKLMKSLLEEKPKRNIERKYDSHVLTIVITSWIILKM